jgi:radical SAM protein with 4Fe4S-binding SPASM domain
MTESHLASIRIQDLPLWDKVLARRAALSFDLEITARCMNDCRHCYINLPAGDPAARQKELSLDEIDSIAGEAVSLGAMWCLITGGEPLLREDFNEVYLTLKRKGLLVSVFTTAQILTEDHIRLFRQYPPRDIEITVYGVTKATYERVTRRAGSFAAFMLGLERLLGAGIKVRLKSMALRSNAAELPEIASFCRQKTKDYFRCDPILHLRFDGNPRRNEEIRSERLSAPEIVALEQADENRAELLRKGRKKLIMSGASRPDSNHLFSCGAGVGSFCIGHDARFRLCSSLCHPGCTYDLRKGRLVEAWNSFVPEIREIRSRRKEFLDTCKVCPIAGLCPWCPAHAHLESGMLDGKVKHFCEVAHARAQALQENATVHFRPPSSPS